MTGTNDQSRGWFYGRDCLACGQFIPMFPENERPTGYRGPPVVHLECPHCHNEADYGVLRLKRREVEGGPA